MATVTATRTNGSKIAGPSSIKKPSIKRFTDIPSSIAIPVGVGAGAQEEEVEIDLAELPDEPDQLCTLLENEGAKKNIWMTIASAYAKEGKTDMALEILNRGLAVLMRVAPKDRTPLSTLQCWLYLEKSRSAPRVEPENASDSSGGGGGGAGEAKTKASYLNAATAALNEASRINPSFPPLVLARGVLSLLRAALQPPAKVLGPNQVEQGERVETLKAALKSFEDASRVSAGRNVIATLGKARTLYALGKYAEAYQAYQDVLQKTPDLIEPDPRIGIGCCLWQLNHPDDAKVAWERALAVNPNSKIANILLGLYHLRNCSQFDPVTPEFTEPYTQAMRTYVAKAYDQDPDYPLTCATMSSYYMPKLAMGTVESLARKAVDLADANSVISDGWYLLARREHFKQDETNLKKLLDLYGRADAARGGGPKGFLLAKFGAAQTQILRNDIDGARYRLEGIVQHHQNVIEAKAILGTIYAQEYLDSLLSTGGKEDKTDAFKKAVAHLEAVRLAWKDAKKDLRPDPNVLAQLSKLYASESPDKALQCLLQLQQLEMDRLPEALQHADEADEAVRRSKQRENMAPELLNNIACFQYQLDRHTEATETFQAALSACTKISGDSNANTDELVMTISYNLARSYEGSQLQEEAKKVYQGLLDRHPEYSDAHTRLAYLQFREDAGEAGQKAIQELFDGNPNDLEVRALYGWYLRRTKKRIANLAEDVEFMHYRSTLKQFDQVDKYSLVGMGNLHLQWAREMKRDTEHHREQRNSQYQRAVGFFKKTLDLDSRNAYAAQGIAIALAETVRDLPSAKQIFSKVKETLKDANVLINIGHIDSDLKQYSKSIESYEQALAKDRQDDTMLLSCLGRSYLKKSRAENLSKDMYTALSTTEKCLSLAPNQVHLKFNLAFVQLELARLLKDLDKTKRTLAEMEEAAKGLEAAIATFAEIAEAPHPPYPKNDLEQRGSMGKTLKGQLDRAVTEQRAFEEANASRLQAAREQREQQIREREEQKRKAEEEAVERKRKLHEERARILEAQERINEKRNDEIRRLEEAEWTENSEGERVKRKSKKTRAPREGGVGGSGARRRKRAEDDSGDEKSADETGDEAGGERRSKKSSSRRKAGGGGGGRRAGSAEGTTPAGSDGEGAAPRKRRKVIRKNESAAKNAKFKSAEFVNDSSDDEDDEVAAGGGGGGGGGDEDVDMRDDDGEGEGEGSDAAPSGTQRPAGGVFGDDDDEEDDDEQVGGMAPATARKANRVIDDDEEDDE